MLELPLALLLVLIAVAFLSGVGITTIGPGGIFVTIALYSLTSLSAGEIAGTAHAMFVATGIVGSAAYLRSGELRSGGGRAIAVVLSGSSLVGALGGAALNALVPRPVFGALLGGFTAAIGLLLLVRAWRGLSALYVLDPQTRSGRGVLVGLGLALGAASSLLGIGGPVLAVPVLVMVGVPMLAAVAVAQVQSVFIATFATVGYVLQGTVLPGLALALGIPLCLGVVVGWRVAHVVDPERLKVALAVILLVVGPYLMF